MKILLDTANLEDIRYFTNYYPIVGVTTNPTILSREGGDVLSLLSEIRSIIGKSAELHVQVTETEYEKILEEGRLLVKRHNVYFDSKNRSTYSKNICIISRRKSTGS